MHVISGRRSRRSFDIVIIVVTVVAVIPQNVVDYGGRGLQRSISGGLRGEGEGRRRRGGSDRRHARWRWRVLLLVEKSKEEGWSHFQPTCIIKNST